jgi:hypothetical protein
MEMEVDWSQTEEGFLGHRQANFELELPRTTLKRKTKKELE